MRHEDTYVVQSLELHLFFARIMKEHALFLKAGFTPVNGAFAKEAGNLQREFERLLRRAVLLGKGIVSCRTVESGEFVTDFTARAERQTQRLTGISIDQAVTDLEEGLRCDSHRKITQELFRQVSIMNQQAIRLVTSLLSLKERTLDAVLSCRMFTVNYPLLLEHIIREGKRYRDSLRRLEDQGFLEGGDLGQSEAFWDRIMMEHALFIRGLLDPTEEELIQTADSFAKEFRSLLSEKGCDRVETLQETIRIRDFKAAGAEGIQRCRIRSLILPLLADHVLREANHFIRLLSDGE